MVLYLDEDIFVDRGDGRCQDRFSLNPSIGEHRSRHVELHSVSLPLDQPRAVQERNSIERF